MVCFFPDFWNRLRMVTTYRCGQGCRYCYARGLLKQYPRDMGLSDFEKALLWLKNSSNKKWLLEQESYSVVGGVRKILGFSPRYFVALLGGEPTLHPDFLRQLELCKEHGVSPTVLSNGTFSERVLQGLSKDLVKTVLINYNPPQNYVKERRERVETNLEALYEKGVDFFFRFNVDSEKTPFDYVLDAAEKYGKKIKFGFTNPGFSRGSHFVSLDDLRPVLKRVLDFVREASGRGIKVWTTRPLFPCLFSEKDWSFLEDKAGVSARCRLGERGNYAIYTMVNPDLSLFPCFNLYKKAPVLTSFGDFGEISAFFRDYVESLRRRPLLEGCGGCGRLPEACQAGCLSYKESLV